jgi:hypothetical protein
MRNQPQPILFSHSIALLSAPASCYCSRIVLLHLGTQGFSLGSLSAQSEVRASTPGYALFFPAKNLSSAKSAYPLYHQLDPHGIIIISKLLYWIQ